MEVLLNYDELAAMTGLTVGFIKKAQFKMGLPYYKIGKRVKFRSSEVNEWIKRRRVAS